MFIVSWNTLLRKYEEKYNPNSEILKKFVNEHDRINEVISFIQEILLSSANSIVCLQECSGDLLSRLKTLKNHHQDIFFTKVNDDEFLITIAPRNKFIHEQWNPHPSSHGYLVVSNRNHRIINCHLCPQRYSDVHVLAYLKSLKSADKLTIIAGDFNEHYVKVLNYLGDQFTVPRFGKTYKHKEIDHVIVGKPTVVYSAEMLHSRGLSDHNVVKLAMFDFEV